MADRRCGVIISAGLTVAAGLIISVGLTISAWLNIAGGLTISGWLTITGGVDHLCADRPTPSSTSMITWKNSCGHISIFCNCSFIIIILVHTTIKWVWFQFWAYLLILKVKTNVILVTHILKSTDHNSIK